MKGKRYTEEQIIGHRLEVLFCFQPLLDFAGQITNNVPIKRRILRDQYLPAFWYLIVTCFNKGSSQKR